jgi:hypothetical protein
MLDSLPDRSLRDVELEALRDQDGVDRVVPVLEFGEGVISLVVGIEGTWYGLHCDHDTAEWKKIVEGSDFDEVMAAHRAWLEEDMERVNEELDFGL